MSISGGMERAVERALAVDATALQVFVKSSNQWMARPFAAGEAAGFRSSAREAGLDGNLLAHASYLVNLASPDAVLRERSRAALRIEVERCAELGIPYLVVHPGSHVGTGLEAGIERIAEGLDTVLGARETRAIRGVTVLLENTAGQGNTIGRSFAEIGAILDRARCRARLGMCFDTCHALAAGYEFRDRRSFLETFRTLEREVGLDRVRAFHVNDSEAELGSRRDRHAHIGRGHVGLEAFRLLLGDRRFRDRPMVLETPKSEDLAEDRTNLGILRSLVER